MRATLRILVPVLVLAFAAVLPFWSGTYPLAVARSVFTYMALAISWDMLLRSGQISFGIAGFFGLGAYAAAIGVLRAGMSPLLSIILAGGFAAAVALVLGFVILRLRTVYFSITTLALAAIFQVIAHNGHSWSGGPEGLVMPGLIFGGEAKALYWVILGAVALAVVASMLFERSRLRLALTAIRNNEVSAASGGIHIFKYLVIAFVVSSFLQGIVGGIQVQGYGFVSPDSAFDANYTLLPLAMALLGGMHSTAGPVIGALLLGVAAEFLKLKIPYGHYLVYGVIILLVILFMPQGLWGLARGRRRAAAGGH
jgi:branched-chain amino acid transport system permease protein